LFTPIFGNFVPYWEIAVFINICISPKKKFLLARTLTVCFIPKVALIFFNETFQGLEKSGRNRYYEIDYEATVFP
jgi:hypothetical protein